MTFLYDLLSVFTTPYILIFILPKQSIEIINFIKLHTIHRKNVGNICSFANFESTDLNNDKKMGQSIVYFAENNSLQYDSQIANE